VPLPIPLSMANSSIFVSQVIKPKIKLKIDFQDTMPSKQEIMLPPISNDISFKSSKRQDMIQNLEVHLSRICELCRTVLISNLHCKLFGNCPYCPYFSLHSIRLPPEKGKGTLQESSVVWKKKNCCMNQLLYEKKNRNNFLPLQNQLLYQSTKLHLLD
jgi:hypothetical protein